MAYGAAARQILFGAKNSKQKIVRSVRKTGAGGPGVKKQSKGGGTKVVR